MSCDFRSCFRKGQLPTRNWSSHSTELFKIRINVRPSELKTDTTVNKNHCTITKLLKKTVHNPETETRFWKILEEDETSTQTLSLKNYEHRRCFRLIGGYPASNGGLDFGSPTPSLFAIKNAILCSWTTFLNGCKERRYAGGLNGGGRS